MLRTLTCDVAVETRVKGTEISGVGDDTAGEEAAEAADVVDCPAEIDDGSDPAPAAGPKTSARLGPCCLP